MNFFYARWTSLLGFLFCLGLLGFAAYLQFHHGLLPCPLCVAQRLCLGFLGLVFLAGALYKPVEKLSKRIHSSFLILFSLLGLLSAGRHVWLTFQPPQALTTCSPTLEYMFRNFSFNQTLEMLLLGSGDCAKVTYRLAGLSIPEWTLLCFIGLFIFSVIRFAVAKSERRLG